MSVIRCLDPRTRTRRGAALVECAVVSPVFMLLVLGMMEFGQAFMAEHVLATAARRGTRLAIIDGSTNRQVEATVRDLCAESLGVKPSALKVEITIERPGGVQVGDLSKAKTGDVCGVSVSIPFARISRLRMHLNGARLHSTCKMEHE